MIMFMNLATVLGMIFFSEFGNPDQEFLSPGGSLYHGTPLTSDETLSPLLESILVIKWLEVKKYIYFRLRSSSTFIFAWGQEVHIFSLEVKKYIHSWDWKRMESYLKYFDAT